MDESTRRQITWIIIIAAILSVITIASYRRSEMDRLADTIAYGTPAQRIAAVRVLVAKQKLMELLEDRPRWVMDNAVAAIDLIGDDDAYYELLTCHGMLDAPVQGRDQTILKRLGRRGVEIFIEAIQDKDAGTRGTAKAPVTAIGKIIAEDPDAKDNPVIDGCMDLLDAWDQYVRDLARDILAGIPLPPVTDRLMPVMQQTEPGQKMLADGTVRPQSTQEFMRAKGTAEAALLVMKIPAIQPIIDNLLKYENPDVRGNACKLLGTIAHQNKLSVTDAPIAPADAAKVVAPLVERLRSDNQWAVRRRAATALGLLGQVARDEGVVPVLIAHLSDNKEVKAAAVEALGRIGDPAAVGPLVNTLVTNRTGAASVLQIALTALGDPAIPQVTGVLSNGETEVRLIATKAIAQIGGPNSVVPLGSMLQDQDLAVRRVASNALRDIADGRVLPQVAAALGDSDWQVYHAARDALANVGVQAVPVLVSALGSANPRVSSMAKEALVRIGDPALAALKASLSTGSATERHWSAIAMGSIGFTAVAPVVAVLKDMSQPMEARAQAALALGKTGSPGATEPLLDALKRQEPTVKIEAIKALSTLADEKATAGLVASLADASTEVRNVAMTVLQDWRLGDVTTQLKSLTSSTDENASRRATILLAELTSVSAHELLDDLSSSIGKESISAQVDVKKLESTMTDTKESMNVRVRAIHAVGYVGAESSLAALETLLKPGNVCAAPAAVAAARIGGRLKQTGAEGQRPELSQAGKQLIDLMLQTDDEELRVKVAAALSIMGEQPVWELIERLKTADPKMKPWIIATLGATGKPATDPVLEIRGSSKDKTLRSWLVSSLALIGDAQALDLIKNLAEEDQPQDEMVKPGAKILERIREVDAARSR